MSLSKSLDLTPAESLMLLDGGWDSPVKMLAFTFADLLMKGVLEVPTRKQTPWHGYLPFEKCVRRGENYRHLDYLKPHEKALAKCVPPCETALCWIPIDEVKYNFERKEVGINWYYKLGFVLCPMLEKGYFRRESKGIFSLKLYYSYPLTEKGQKARSRIEELLNDGILNLERWVKDEPAMANAYFDLCGANILLLQNHYDLKTLLNWSIAASNRMPKNERCSLSERNHCWYDYGLLDHALAKSGSRTSQDRHISRPGFSSLDFRFLDAFKSFNEFESMLERYWDKPPIST
jgi:hypothetical protein